VRGAITGFVNPIPRNSSIRARQTSAGPTTPNSDCIFTLIAAAAGMTDKLRLGHMVAGNTYRNPGLVAKMATTIDQVSHGRFTLSIGAAWFKREHEAYGWEYPSLKERSDRFEEACALIRALFTSDSPVDFQG